MGQEPLNLPFQKAASDDFCLSLDVNPTVCGLMLEKEGEQYISAYVAATIAAYAPTQITWSSTEGQEWKNKLPATAAWGCIIVVPVGSKGYTAGEGIRWFQVGGWCRAACDGTEDIDAGDFVEVLNGTAVFIANATGTTLDKNTKGICPTAYTTAATITLDVYLINKLVEIAAA
ncbi:hypothetical protein LCGC14_1495650 [marine sediment metagenome]|uniref:Uncharacterized protein n=1 Tax=marine sediment metagenome TaxID=412755 RepID=A0A0F9M730_9ZZZZ